MNAGWQKFLAGIDASLRNTVLVVMHYWDCARRPRDLLNLQRVRTFLDQVKLVSLHAGEGITLPTRPVDFDPFRLPRFAQSEGHSQVALREIASATGDFANLRDAAGNDANACANRIAIALGTNQLKIQEMIGITEIVQQRGRIVIIGHQNVDESIIVEISKSDTTSNPWWE
jgi:hypothetical protein